MDQVASAEFLVAKRDGRTVVLEPELIRRAVSAAYQAHYEVNEMTSLDGEQKQQINAIVDDVIREILEPAKQPQGVGVEQIQDVVERQLQEHKQFAVARRYIIYREERTRARRLRMADTPVHDKSQLRVKQPDGRMEQLNPIRLSKHLHLACRGLESRCKAEELVAEVQRAAYDGITLDELARATILAARARIERDPAYDRVAGRLIQAVIYRESLGRAAIGEDLAGLYRQTFDKYIRLGIENKRLTPELESFDLNELAAALRPERDELFPYLGLQTIYDRYLLHVQGRRIEAPQYFWMRVAMGLAINEGEEKNARAIEFYDILSQFLFTSATPTLFNSATLHPQLSSCYLSTVQDDLEHIFKCISDNARLSKWAGGLGNDWTNIRATNSYIAGTNGQSQGVIPFLKVVSDTAVAVNQGGKRKGAVCAYLETWHLDIEEFLELRRNTGDERRRTHDMHTANWIPDLFMKRVRENADWTLFSPDEVPDLHDLTGRAFEARYEHYERLADQGEIKLSRRLPAVDLWRKMLTRLFETGHPWITWKDPSNLRSPQDHAGVVHSSNLCTEILLNTSADETAVCNLGSINLKNHMVDGELDEELLSQTVRTAVRMLDNVIDINFYPTPEAANANRRHRPVGLGLMGFQDALLEAGVSYASHEAVEFADRSMEAISYYALLASSELAHERGTYESYEGSKWQRGLLPIDTIELLQEERGCDVLMDRTQRLDWQQVRESIARHGMRNSNVMAIAPTATISTIIGVTQSIEPHYKNLFVKSNLSGEFTQVNEHLVRDLESIGLWDEEMLEAIKYYDGSIKEIERIPEVLRNRYATAFEVEPHWIIECASRRQKWIDMGQSLNLYLAQASGRKLNDMYMSAWERGLKTTYYLRSQAATTVEKSTSDINRFGFQPRWMNSRSASGELELQRGQTCNLDGDCEACQ
ncbi:MAG: ribonucleoside-diphosphate reductase subunit alpha [Planctomycetales bacterium]|nr:ribonucleoside-diphosphate reductase subunit alpha [Planctomycetales bacterium]